MKIFIKFVSILLAGTLLVSTNAFAGLITISGGSSGSISTSNNDLLDNLITTDGLSSPLSGIFGGNVYIDGSAPSTGVYFTATFYGFEAAFKNEFIWSGGTIFQNSGANNSSGVLVGTSSPLYGSFGAGDLLPFVFDTNTPLGSVANGLNNDGTTSGTPDFFAYCAGGGTSCDTLYVFLDDGGGIGPDDDNHDDMVIIITANVPEPATIALLGLGLIGLGAAGYRKRS